MKWNSILLLSLSSMKSSSRYVSNLDLKYLGSKFITIPDSHLETSQLHSIRKTRTGEYPSLLKNSTQDTTLHTSGFDSSTKIYTSEDMPDRYNSRDKTKVKKTDNEIKGFDYSDNEKKEIQRYRNLIKRIKSDNRLIQKEITNMYRQNKINDHEPKTKPVKRIFKTSRDIEQKMRKPPIGQQARQYNQVYQRLTGQDNPYRLQSLQLQKKLSSSNMPKSFQFFLQSENKRIPEFIKNIR